MKKSVLKTWIKELRSGKYKQCTGRLRRGEEGAYSYCSLGVLNIVLRSTFIKDGSSVRGAVTFLPEYVFDDNFTHKLEDKAVEKNDLDNKSFKEIADWLEETLLRK